MQSCASRAWTVSEGHRPPLTNKHTAGSSTRQKEVHRFREHGAHKHTFHIMALMSGAFLP